MIKIRGEQWAAFERIEQGELAARLAVWLAEEHPEQRCRGREAIHTFTRREVERAGEYGLRSDHHIARYVDVAFKLMTKFGVDPDAPWVRAVMADEKRGASERIALLNEKLQRLEDAVDRVAEEVFRRALEGAARKRG
jgi:hypothetical protein